MFFCFSWEKQKNKMFIAVARRALYGPCSYVAVPSEDLVHWRRQFGEFETKQTSAHALLVKISDLSAKHWGDVKASKLVESSTPLATGPQDPNEHLTSNCMVWALFAGSTAVFKSVREHGKVRTILSWYGHGGYDPEAPSISPRELARIYYDPEYPDIELM